ncbi:MAG: hypothetical protein ABL989_06900 [Gammaproteobacteria bacterium]
MGSGPRLTPLLLVIAVTVASASTEERAVERPWVTAPAAPRVQTVDAAAAKSAGCLDCHTATDAATMHANPAVVLGCTDCHGGDASVRRDKETAEKTIAYDLLLKQAHILPRYPEAWEERGSANPVRSYTLLNREAPEFIRFINPGDYRIARESCGSCHLDVIEAAERSLMATNAMFWGGAAYNNGILPFKNYLIGEGYTRDGEPAVLTSAPLDELGLTLADARDRGVLTTLYPLPRWENLRPADVFRVFEDGGRNILNTFPETGIPNAAGQVQRLEEPGRPDVKQSNRGPGTGARIAVPVLNIHKTRLNDPLMWYLGTNDQPGDYRSSGCSSCHVVYANDRNPFSASVYAGAGHRGVTQTADPTIPTDRPGHPIRHEFSRAIPTSQCMTCHMHQPNMFMNSFLGYTMWDYESDAPAMWPAEQQYPDAEQMRRVLDRNPEGAAPRGKWADEEFLARVSELNPGLRDTQFADYHGHGWNFRGVFKRDRKGNLLDKDGALVTPDDPQKWGKAVHMQSTHVDAGMQCVDCHYAQDSHGTGHLMAEVAQAVEIDCKDCHGTTRDYPTLRTSGPAAGPNGTDLSTIRNPDGRKRFEWRGETLIQRSAVDPKLEWTVSLVKDSVTRGNAHYNEKAARAKLMSRNTGSQYFGTDVAWEHLAHNDDELECYTCHTSWTTSCGGCHLPIEANWKTERHRPEGGTSRNYATYNPQVAREEIFMLGRRGPAEGFKVAPVRSSSALVLSSTNANRERIYVQQPPVAASGYSSQAMNPHYPHTERKTETKTCSDCHLSAAGDNNAILAQTLGQGTQFINFLGLNAWVGEERAVSAVQVTEWDEPQAVIGSYLQRYAYPDFYAAHEKRGRELPVLESHRAGRAECLQLRGEYLYVAEGPKGFRVYDVSGIANKGLSQKIISAPFGPLGQDTHVATTNATCVALATTQPVHPPRNDGDLMRKDNLEQPFASIYNYAVITDAVEGLILVDINTLADGEFRNNFLGRALTWDAGGALKGARHVTVAGSTLYITTSAGVAVVDVTDALRPNLLTTVPLPGARASMQQFRYLFVTDGEGLKVVDVTVPAKARLVPGAVVPLKDAHKVFVSRTYAFVAAGSEGLAIVDVEKPEAPRLHQMFDGGGAVRDARDVVVAATNASLFAYVADGAGGLKVLQLTAPDTQPNFYGFSPEPKPQVIASRKTRSPALALSRPLERDRAVDESGGQVAVFGRRGSRPFQADEMRRFYLDDQQLPWVVRD